jgi:hypothetical protein
VGVTRNDAPDQQPFSKLKKHSGWKIITHKFTHRERFLLTGLEPATLTFETRYNFGTTGQENQLGELGAKQRHSKHL